MGALVEVNFKIIPMVFFVSYMQGKSMFNHNNKEIMTISQRVHLITVLNKKRN